MRWLSLLALIPVVLTEPPAQSTLDTPLYLHWPASVPLPRNLRPYDRTQYAQRLVILNGQDDLRLHPINQDDHGTENPNRKPEWRTNGGLHAATGWQSYTGLALPEDQPIRYWTARTEAGARRPLPRYYWQFPEGTRVVDLLVEGDRPFELRQLKKENGQWKGNVLWESERKPRGYQPLTRKCADCHQFAGGSYGYGTILRGSDGVFSWSLFADQVMTPRGDFPVAPWR